MGTSEGNQAASYEGKCKEIENRMYLVDTLIFAHRDPHRTSDLYNCKTINVLSH